MSRQERAARRAARIAARQARQAAREERGRKRAEERLALGGPEPPLATIRDNHDPLITYDRWGQPHQGHPYRDIWRNCPGFLVCGGPSLNTYPLHELAGRGVVSLAINNAAAHAPVRAMTFSDPAEKFHHQVFLDPAMLKLVPKPKLGNRVRAKLPDGTFRWTSYLVRDCPNVVGYERNCEFDPDAFLTSPAATWGQNAAAVEKNGRPKNIFTFFLGIRLLHYLGVRRIYLLGVDFHMDPSGERNYAWRDPRGAAVVGGNNSHYRVAIQMLAELRPRFEAAGLEVYNCNPTSELRVFPHVSFDAAIADCRGPIPAGALDCEGWYAKGVHMTAGGQQASTPNEDDREATD